MPITNEMMAQRHEITHKRRGRRVTYKTFVSKDIDFATGATAATYTSKYVDYVLVWDLTHETVIASNGRYKIGDKGCSILTTRIPESPPSKESRVVIDSTEYMIENWEQSGDNAKYVLVLRKP